MFIVAEQTTFYELTGFTQRGRPWRSKIKY
jgi:hypothetical protein